MYGIKGSSKVIRVQNAPSVAGVSDIPEPEVLSRDIEQFLKSLKLKESIL